MTTNAPSGPPNVRKAPSGTFLSPIDFSIEHERTILRDQRIICGWNDDKIQAWAKSMEQGKRAFFWILMKPSDTLSLDVLNSVERDNEKFIPAGHVSLDKSDLSGHDVRPDKSLADVDAGVLTITSLFVLPRYTRLGLGAFAMDECERLARVPPYGSLDCVAVTVNCLASRYCIGGMPGPDGLGMWERCGMDFIPRDNKPWYEERGYVWYKEEHRYSGPDLKGNTLWWYGNFLRKELV